MPYGFNFFQNDQSTRESVMDGLMASTGRLFLNGGSGKPTLWFSNYDREFVEAVDKLLNVKSTISAYEAPGCMPLHILQTVSTDTFSPAFERWYGRCGVKSFPAGGIDSVALYFWHMASGSVMSDGLYLTTDGYTSHGYKRAAFGLADKFKFEFQPTDYDFLRVTDVEQFLKVITPVGDVPPHKARSDASEAVLIGVSGKARHGKDTYCDLLKGYSSAPVVRLAMADPLKNETASMLTGQYVDFSESPYEWVAKFREVRAAMDDPEMKEGYRGINVWWGTEFRRTMFSQLYWVKRFEHHARQLMGSRCVLVCTDVRFPNEVELIKAMGGKVVRVERSGVPSTSTHPSEVSLDDYRGWDAVMKNEGSMDDYRKQVGESWMKFAAVAA